MFCFYTALAGGYVMLFNAHVNVEILYEKFSPQKKRLINVITSVCFFSVIITLLWKSGYAAWESWEAKEESFSLLASPIYPSKIIIPIGAFLFLLQGTAKFIRDLILLFKKEVPAKA
jgi:TRAP-type mannitol/chloroaromatic compound transport system permease small subunit